MLRHPVVISSMEEDFKKIGLLKDEQSLHEGLPSGDGGVAGTGDPGKHRRKEGSKADLEMGYKTGGDRLTGKPSGHKDPSIDYAEEEDDEDFDPIAEAMEFSEAFETEWSAMGDSREIDLDEDDMEMIDSMAEDIVELPGGVLDEDDDEDEGPTAGTMSAVAESMAHIESIMESMHQQEGSDAAIPAFANVALIAERLSVFFNGLDEDDAAQHYAEMAEEAAGIVQVLRTEDEDEIDFGLVNDTFVERVDSLLKGLEIYSDVTEGDDEDDDDDDEDDDEGND